MPEDTDRPAETSFRLDLEPAELKIVHTALKTLYDDLGHEETDVERVVRSVLAKLPAGDTIAAIDLHLRR
jgi:hypothetical protein